MAFLYQRNAPRLRLAAARDDPAVYNHGLVEFRAEKIANHAAVGGNPIINAHANYRPGRDRE
jgi:hypothetical protein